MTAAPPGAGVPRPPRRRWRLLARDTLAPGVIRLGLEALDADFAFEPGQWISLELDVAGGRHLRAYSVSSFPAELPRLDLAVTLVADGIVVPRLLELPLGAIVEGTGPFGTLRRTPGAGRPEIYLASGTGVAPFRPMIRAALDEAGDTPVLLMVGAEREADLLYQAEFVSWAGSGGRFHYWPVVASGRGATIRRGDVMGHLGEALRRYPAACCHLCGIRQFVNPLLECLRAAGVARGDLRYERYD